MNPNPATPGVTDLGPEDVLIFCDLKRLVQQPDGNHRNGDPNLPMSNDKMPQEDYNMCYNYLLSTITAVYYRGPVAALTESVSSSGLPFSTMQLCPWYLEQQAAAKYRTHSNINPVKWYYLFADKLSSITEKQIDMIAFLCSTLLHELTHVVPVIVDPFVPLSTSATAKIIDVSKAEHGLDIGPYGWKNIEQLASPAAEGGAPHLAYKNSDSWAYFGIGAQQLTQGNRINRDDSMSDIGWTVNLDGSVANNLLVSLANWTPARKLRTRDSASSRPAAFRKLLKGRLDRQVTRTTTDLSKTPLTTTSNATYINDSSLYGTPLPSEEIRARKSHLIQVLQQVMAYHPSHRCPRYGKIRQVQLFRRTLAVAQHLYCPRGILIQKLLLPISWDRYHPSSTENILGIFTASTFYIPSITDLKVFPTLMVKNPDPKGTDDTEIPFVKVTIPDGPCEPLPKVHHGGLFGALFNLGSDLVDGVLDDACHLVFPIVKGVKLPLPEWLVLEIYPPQESFPDSLEEEKSLTTSTSFITTSTSSSKLSISTTASSSSLKSSSCSASAVSSCVASCAVSAGSTQSCSTICSRVTACSGTATTSSTISFNTSESGSWKIHQVPSNFINIQSSIQSVLAAAWASAPTSFHASSYTSVKSSVSLAQHISSTSAASSQQRSNIAIQSTRYSSLSGVNPILTNTKSVLSNSSTSTSLLFGIPTLSEIPYSGISSTATVSVTLFSSTSLSETNPKLQPGTLSENATLFLTQQRAQNQDSETQKILLSVAHPLEVASSPNRRVSEAPLSKLEVYVARLLSSTSQVSVSRSGDGGNTSSSTTSSPRTTSFAAPTRSSTIAVPSSYVPSTTTPAIQATTPIKMFQMNFWHQNDNKKKSTGNLWYMYVNKLTDINLSHVDPCQTTGLVSIQDQNITSHDPLPSSIPYPEGKFSLPSKSAGAGCYYDGGRSAVGDVFCPGKPTVSCQDNGGEVPVVCDGNTSIYPMVLCGLEK
ncbi:uncharacterized protein EAE97_011078 [Botrytis byssoidea]|uniref:Uncharacterized protein n=1 Tax=Botrytis byssoidea TaxID=139641 RepID=A0A9P5LUA0_9HELO|nr:uncharacterized protein EAE97_011078 [Botrytis byssoidea]KAF7922336.1 hypothetical protein EAE97_011078 [Botrytis byssoidea]